MVHVMKSRFLVFRGRPRTLSLAHQQQHGASLSERTQTPEPNDLACWDAPLTRERPVFVLRPRWSRGSAVCVVAVGLVRGAPATGSSERTDEGASADICVDDAARHLLDIEERRQLGPLVRLDTPHELAVGGLPHVAVVTAEEIDVELLLRTHAGESLEEWH
jgi:hypothetical protein